MREGGGMTKSSKIKRYFSLSRNERYVSLVVCLVSLSVGLISPYLYVYLRKIGAGYLSLGWIQLLSNFILAIAYFLSGTLSNYFNGKTIFLMALLCSLLAGLTFNFALIWYIFVLGLLIGKLGEGFREISTFVVISSSTIPERRATTFGVVRTFQYAGAVIAPLAGGVVASSYGMRSVFLLPIPLLILAVIISYARLKITIEEKIKEKYMFSLRRIIEVTSINRNITILIVMSFLGQFFMEFGNPYYMVFMKDVLSAPDTMLGLAASAIAVGSLIAGIPSGFASDVMRQRKPFILMNIFIAAIAVTLTAMAFNPVFIVITYLLFGISNVIGITATQAYIADVVSSSMRGNAFSAILTASWLGGMFSPPIAGALAETYGLRTPFVINAAGVFLQGFIVWALFIEGRWKNHT